MVPGVVAAAFVVGTLLTLQIPGGEQLFQSRLTVESSIICFSNTFVILDQADFKLKKGDVHYYCNCEE